MEPGNIGRDGARICPGVTSSLRSDCRTRPQPGPIYSNAVTTELLKTVGLWQGDRARAPYAISSRAPGWASRTAASTRCGACPRRCTSIPFWAASGTNLTVGTGDPHPPRCARHPLPRCARCGRGVCEMCNLKSSPASRERGNPAPTGPRGARPEDRLRAG